MAPTVAGGLKRLKKLLGGVEAKPPRPHFGRVDEGDPASNIAWNRERWGDASAWREHDLYGYQWGHGKMQSVCETTQLAERWLLPHLGERRGLKILELAPGAGRFTAELIRLASSLVLVDLNQACIDICRERFKYYPNVRYLLNDGRSCDVVEDRDFDLIACFDAMVHMAPPVIEAYVTDFAGRLRSGGLLWLDHAGRGENDGHRTAMTDEIMREFAEDNGLKLVAQHFRNESDCISVMEKP